MYISMSVVMVSVFAPIAMMNASSSSVMIVTIVSSMMIAIPMMMIIGTMGKYDLGHTVVEVLMRSLVEEYLHFVL